VTESVSDTLTEITRWSREEAPARLESSALPPHYSMTFETPPEVDPEFLVQFDAAGPIPVPAVGETIVLHGRRVRVRSALTHYTRSDEDGRVQVLTRVVVDLDGVEQGTIYGRTTDAG